MQPASDQICNTEEQPKYGNFRAKASPVIDFIDPCQHGQQITLPKSLDAGLASNELVPQIKL